MEIGDRVMHPRYGVGTINSVEKRTLEGEIRSYYLIPKPDISSTILVPVDTAEELGLRPLCDRKTLEKALGILNGDGKQISSPPKFNETVWGDPIALAEALRYQSTAPKPRHPKAGQKSQINHAKRLLAEEMSVVLGMSEEKATALIEGATEAAQTQVAAKS